MVMGDFNDILDGAEKQEETLGLKRVCWITGHL